MSDATGPVREVTEGLIKPVYQDLVHPAAQEIGTALGRTVHAALMPLRGVVWAAEQAEEYVYGALMKRLKDVPPGQIGTPKLTVAGPAIEALKFVGGEPVLREMYANLLATAMDRQTAERAHPAFVEILKQLTPDEAKILGYIPTTSTRPVISMYSIAPDTGLRHEVIRHFSLIGMAAGCEYAHLTPSYLENLCRLGLTVIPEDAKYAGADAYEAVETAPQILQFKARIESESKQTAIVRQVFDVTNFGTQFIAACVLERGGG